MFELRPHESPSPVRFSPSDAGRPPKRRRISGTAELRIHSSRLYLRLHRHAQNLACVSSRTPLFNGFRDSPSSGVALAGAILRSSYSHLLRFLYVSRTWCCRSCRLHLFSRVGANPSLNFKSHSSLSSSTGLSLAKQPFTPPMPTICTNRPLCPFLCARLPPVLVIRILGFVPERLDLDGGYRNAYFVGPAAVPVPIPIPVPLPVPGLPVAAVAAVVSSSQAETTTTDTDGDAIMTRRTTPNNFPRVVSHASRRPVCVKGAPAFVRRLFGYFRRDPSRRAYLVESRLLLQGDAQHVRRVIPRSMREVGLWGVRGLWELGAGGLGLVDAMTTNLRWLRVGEKGKGRGSGGGRGGGSSSQQHERRQQQQQQQQQHERRLQMQEERIVHQRQRHVQRQHRERAWGISSDDVRVPRGELLCFLLNKFVNLKTLILEGLKVRVRVMSPIPPIPSIEDHHQLHLQQLQLEGEDDDDDEDVPPPLPAPVPPLPRIPLPPVPNPFSVPRPAAAGAGPVMPPNPLMMMAMGGPQHQHSQHQPHLGLNSFSSQESSQHISMLAAAAAAAAAAAVAASAATPPVVTYRSLLSMEFVRKVANGSRISRLQLNDCAVTDEMCEVLVRSSQIRTLGLFRNLISVAGLQNLKENVVLNTLGVSHNPRLQDSGAQAISQCRGLRTVHLRGCGVTELGLYYLLHNLGIRRIVVGKMPFKIVKVPNYSLVHKHGSYSCIEVLNLARTFIPMRFVTLLAQFSRLTYVCFTSCSLTDDHVRVLVGIPSVCRLCVSGNPGLTAISVNRIAGNSRIQEVFYAKNHITDALAQKFYLMRSLRELHLSFTNVTDLSLVQQKDPPVGQIPPLQRRELPFRSLRVLNVFGSRMTSLGVLFLKTRTNIEILVYGVMSKRVVWRRENECG